MNRPELIDITKKTFHSCLSLLANKGNEYTNENESVFKVFEDCGNSCGVDTMVPIKLFMDKHYSSIANYIRRVQSGEQISAIDDSLSESIDGRIQDMLNYLVMLEAYITERRKSENPKKEESKPAKQPKKEETKSKE